VKITNRYIQNVTGLFNKYNNICNGNLSNSLVTPYIYILNIQCASLIVNSDENILLPLY